MDSQEVFTDTVYHLELPSVQANTDLLSRSQVSIVRMNLLKIKRNCTWRLVLIYFYFIIISMEYEKIYAILGSPRNLGKSYKSTHLGQTVLSDSRFAFLKEL